jgi:hypothetical protein
LSTPTDEYCGQRNSPLNWPINERKDEQSERLATFFARVVLFSLPGIGISGGFRAALRRGILLEFSSA